MICIDPLHLARSGGDPADVAGARPAVSFLTRRSPTAYSNRASRTRTLFGKLGMGTRLMPGEGTLPLRELLAALPKDVPLSVELPHALAPAGTSARGWAKTTLEKTREFLATG